MSTENLSPEKLQLKVENQNRLIKELTNENEELYHQYNHLMIRNGKMLKRVDDLQKIIDDLHVRIEELQLINGNMMQINDRLRTRSDGKFQTNNVSNGINDSIKSYSHLTQEDAGIDIDDLVERWKSFPGQPAQNLPNLKKQMLMLSYLYNTPAIRANDLFNMAQVGGVTGARYVATLKKFGLIRYTGARKKGHYEITRQGIDFVEKGSLPLNRPAELIDNASAATVLRKEYHSHDAQDL
ncbi:MAG: hypothetical protein IPP51_08070 [Bacteroidetes bacterium]|nr:hypothetical protein [Bacteroidota bacterium]